MIFYKLKKKKLIEKITPKLWLCAGLLWIIQNILCNRKHDFLVDHNYLERWFIIPKNRFINIYYHKFTGSDDIILHDHPWHSMALVLKGFYFEHTPRYVKPRLTGSIAFRSGNDSHRIEIGSKEVHTLFITGPKYKEWGFFTSKGWVIWTEHLKNRYIFNNKNK
jgi:hypothetical protein